MQGGSIFRVIQKFINVHNILCSNISTVAYTDRNYSGVLAIRVSVKNS